MRRLLLDSFAILCWLQEEEGWETVDDLLQKAEAGLCTLTIHIVNLGEVYYSICRRGGESRAEHVLAQLKKLAIEIRSVTDADVMAAARIKARHRLSYADAFAVSSARKHGEAIVSGDPEFRSVEGKLVPMLWLGQN